MPSIGEILQLRDAAECKEIKEVRSGKYIQEELCDRDWNLLYNLIYILSWVLGDNEVKDVEDMLASLNFKDYDVVNELTEHTYCSGTIKALDELRLLNSKLYTNLSELTKIEEPKRKPYNGRR